MIAPGFVSIVGAGLGAADLITVRGLDRIRTGDVVVYDRLIDPDLLVEARARAERVYVGKARGTQALSQRGIEELLIERARAGRTVVRLKGGDPFLFGRGGEEALALARAGIPFEIVPGISSAIAAPASMGIPVTHRGLASNVTIITGHDPDATTDWQWLGAGRGTIVILMGLESLSTICRQLIDAGRDASTPAAILSSATLPDELRVTGTLDRLPELSVRAAIQSPATIIIGDVAAFPELLAEACAQMESAATSSRFFPQLQAAV